MGTENDECREDDGLDGWIIIHYHSKVFFRNSENSSGYFNFQFFKKKSHCIECMKLNRFSIMDGMVFESSFIRFHNGRNHNLLFQTTHVRVNLSAREQNKIYIPLATGGGGCRCQCAASNNPDATVASPHVT